MAIKKLNLLCLMLIIGTACIYSQTPFPETYPQYVDGDEALATYMQEKTKVTQEAIEKSGEGYVQLLGVINEKGEVSPIRFLNKLYPEIDTAVWKMVEAMPDWKPGKLDNGEGFTSFYVFTLVSYISDDGKPTIAAHLPRIENYSCSVNLKSGVSTYSPQLEGVPVWASHYSYEEDEEPMIDIAELKQDMPIVVEDIGPTVYTDVDIMPEYKGGQKAMDDFIRKKIKYSPDMMAEGLDGTVIVCLVIDSDGRIASVKIVKSLSLLFDKEAIRVVKSMPKWIPAKVNGENVETFIKIPIVFELPAHSK